MRPSFFIFHFSFFIALLALSGCDYVDKRASEAERSEGLYHEAMSEYVAGRLDTSIEKFETLLKSNPGNASARFQLACLLQDHRKDPMGAICNYREYKALFPKGDKIKIAEDRMAACERQLATLLVKKYNLGGIVAQDETIARLRDDNAKLNAALEARTQELDGAKGDLAALRRENDRIRRMVLAGAEDDAVAAPVPAKSAAAKPSDVPSEDDEVPSANAEIADRLKLSADVDNLIAEEKAETSEKTPFGKTQRRVEQPQAAPTDPPHEERPEFYTVQEGDTLFKLAIRFYGRRSAWTAIRDANKAAVSSDGRIKAGQTLRMP